MFRKSNIIKLLFLVNGTTKVTTGYVLKIIQTEMASGAIPLHAPLYMTHCHKTISLI